MKKIFSLVLTIFLFVNLVQAQTAEVTISLNEQFFETLMDAVFTNLKTPSFPISENRSGKNPDENALSIKSSTADTNIFQLISDEKNPNTGSCDESIRLLRETNGVRTAVRFRNGRINAPIAFAGSYNPPLIGCIDFEGWADSDIVLEFDQRTQALYGRAKVSTVSLNGTGGVGSGFIGRMVQSSIDNKVNPIKILDLERVSFMVPVQDSGSLRMKAIGMRHTIGEGVLNVHITYQFLKGS